MFTETYSKEKHYLCKVASLPALTPATIIKMTNYIWCITSLDEDSSSLNSVLTVLNFFDPPVNQADYRLNVSMETRLAMSLREEDLDKYVKQHKPKTMDSFVRGRQTSLEDLTILLETYASPTCIW